jgi:hypothetical protein
MGTSAIRLRIASSQTPSAAESEPDEPVPDTERAVTVPVRRDTKPGATILPTPRETERGDTIPAPCDTERGDTIPAPPDPEPLPGSTLEAPQLELAWRLSWAG